MRKERALQVVLVVVALLFLVLIYPMAIFFSHAPALAMMLSLYVTLGIFLLLAARKPAEHRSLIAFTAWSSFAHAAVMGMQAYQKIIERNEMIGVVVLVIVGVVLIALHPGKKSEEQVSTAGA
jgi:hypothetical protein